MTGQARRGAVVDPPRTEVPTNPTPTTATDPALAAWRRVEVIRREWLAVGLATERADRPATEESLAALYARHGRGRPRFVWVDSPLAARKHLTGLPTHEDLRRWIVGRPPPGVPPIASDLAAGLSRLRSSLADAVVQPSFDRPPPKRKPHEPWPILPAADALRLGVPFSEMIRQGVREALRTSLSEGFALPVRTALAGSGPVQVGWYGQQEAYWIAVFDGYRRLGLAHYPRADSEHFEYWATLARSAGWWWPGEQFCVVVERPALVHTEPVPGAWHEQLRLRSGTEPAVEYRDGWRPDLNTFAGRGPRR